MDTLKDPVNDR